MSAVAALGACRLPLARGASQARGRRGGAATAAAVSGGAKKWARPSLNGRQDPPSRGTTTAVAATTPLGRDSHAPDLSTTAPHHRAARRHTVVNASVGDSGTFGELRDNRDDNGDEEGGSADVAASPQEASTSSSTRACGLLARLSPITQIVAALVAAVAAWHLPHVLGGAWQISLATSSNAL